MQEFRAEDAVNTYPELIQAAEAPVIDTSCAALLQLARRVHECGQKVVLTGEGADEWLVGYPWHKAAKLIEYLDILPGVRLSDLARRGYLRLKNVPQYPREFRRGIEEAIGGPNAWIDSYGLLGLSKLRFYSESMHEVRQQANPWADLQIPARTRQTLASAAPRHLGRGPRDPRRPPAAGQRRPRGHAFLGGSAVSVFG